jgi:hypothetical protein
MDSLGLTFFEQFEGIPQGRDNALAAILCSLAHEVVHYQQWVTTGEMHERGVPRKAAAIVDAYAMSVDYP